jgi:hypothetical protein
MIGPAGTAGTAGPRLSTLHEDYCILDHLSRPLLQDAAGTLHTEGESVQGAWRVGDLLANDV